MQDGQLSLLVGEGRATYRPVNSTSVSYQTAGAQSAAGQYPGQWNGGTADRRPPGTVSSDVSSAQSEPAPRPTRRKRTTSRDSQHSNRVNLHTFSLQYLY